MSAAFTPAPWWSEDRDIAGIICIMGDGDRVVCELDGFSCDVTGDADLIAAGPELLSAAETGLEYIIEAANERGKKDAVFDNMMRDLRRVEAVIAKARGEQ